MGCVGRPKQPLVLSNGQREELEAVARSRSLPHALVRRAQIILLSAEGLTNKEVGLRVGMSLHGRTESDVARTEHGGPFDPYVMLHLPAAMFVNGFAAWRADVRNGFLEFGVRVYNIFNAGFRDNPAVIRFDGSELGGEQLGRRIFLYLRGVL